MKTDKELATEVVIAVINAKVPKLDERTQGGVLPLTTDDVPVLIAKVYETLTALKNSDSAEQLFVD